MNDASDDPYVLCSTANDLYQGGLSNRAAEVYELASRLAAEKQDLYCLVHALRWTGNAYMWAYRHDQAYPFLLQAISYDGNPEAPLDDVYGAMTDLGLLSVRSRPYAALRKILAETRDFLERRHLTPWDHRVDLLEAMGHLRRGEFAQAHRLACRAWQRHLGCVGGPHYQSAAYLNVRYRAAHGLEDVAAMQQALQLLQTYGEKSIVMSRLRRNNCTAMATAFHGLGSADDVDQVDALTAEAIGTMEATEQTRDEAVEAFRLQALCGHIEKADACLRKAGFTEAADTALLRLDIELCRLGARIGWRPPFYRPVHGQELPPRPLLNGDEADRVRVRELAAKADRLGALEDQRLEGRWWNEALATRRRWLGDDVPETHT